MSVATEVITATDTTTIRVAVVMEGEVAVTEVITVGENLTDTTTGSTIDTGIQDMTIRDYQMRTDLFPLDYPRLRICNISPKMTKSKYKFCHRSVCLLSVNFLLPF